MHVRRFKNLCPCFYLCFCPSLCLLFFFLSVFPCVCLSVCLSVFLYVCLSVSLAVCLFAIVCLSLSLWICCSLCLCLLVCLFSFCLSLCLSVLVILPLQQFPPSSAPFLYLSIFISSLMSVGLTVKQSLVSLSTYHGYFCIRNPLIFLYFFSLCLSA